MHLCREVVLAMPDYTPREVLKAADPKVIAAFIHAWKEAKSPRKALVALTAAGIVESGLRSLNYGNRDSIGSLQQRRGWGSKADRMNPAKAARAFLADLTTRVWPKHHQDTAGQLAQRVQRSAYPNRYDQATPAAEYVIARYLGHQDDPETLPAPKTYAVRAGDTLSSIAKRHDTTVAVLVKLNGIADPDRLAVGRTLRLP